MKQFKNIRVAAFFLSLTFLLINDVTFAQPAACTYKQTVVNLDFGTSAKKKDVDLSFLSNYKQADGSCPDDGFYSFTSYTADCFSGNWHTLPEDHTAGDANGRMLVVNAAEKPAMFFANSIAGLKAGTNYEISAWFANVCLRGSGCNPTPPVISISVNCPGRQLLKFETGEISPTSSPLWSKYSGTFTMPQGETAILILMDDITKGGCGNDFAMDDILIKECMPPGPPVQLIVTKKTVPVPVKKPTASGPVVNKPVLQKPSPKPVVPLPVAPVAVNKNSTPVEKVPGVNPVKTAATVKEQITGIQLPAPVVKRTNTLVKEIETTTAEMMIDLYDNGEIDGDTVTVYHNNKLVVAHAGLSAKPVMLTITVDEQNPYHELLMVANNLGSIPPNTSLMVITAGKKRYEIFISSTEQQNAKVVINWKKD